MALPAFNKAGDLPPGVHGATLPEVLERFGQGLVQRCLVSQHLEAHARFGASVFWTRRSGAIGGERAMIEYWQVRRQGGQRGIVEILPEGT